MQGWDLHRAGINLSAFLLIVIAKSVINPLSPSCVPFRSEISSQVPFLEIFSAVANKLNAKQ